MWHPKEWLKDIVAACVSASPRTWLHNNNLKYINIRIDMRDGSFCMQDRNGDPVDPTSFQALLDEVHAYNNRRKQ